MDVCRLQKVTGRAWVRTIGGERGSRKLEELGPNLDGEDALVGQDLGDLGYRRLGMLARRSVEVGGGVHCS